MKREELQRKRRIERARAALALLSDEDKHGLLREFKVCGCDNAVRAVVRSPSMVVGASIGALLGAMWSRESRTPPKVEE